MNKIFQVNDYSPKFSGHETFPLRFGWLKKSYDAIERVTSNGESDNPFADNKAIANFGVGKNMVASMQHWAEATGLIFNNQKIKKEAKKGFSNTWLAEALLDDNGFDPYLENLATIWLLHWNLVSKPTYTTWFWAFSHFTLGSFDREQLLLSLSQLCADEGWSKRASLPTLKRDVDCFVRTYCSRPLKAGEPLDSSIDCPLAELNLLLPTGKRDGFRFNFGDKPSLTDACLAYIVFDYWRNVESGADAKVNSISLEALALAPGSPGQCLLLDADALTQRLEKLEETTAGDFWLDPSAGLKQVRKKSPLSDEKLKAMLAQIYENTAARGANYAA